MCNSDVNAHETPLDSRFWTKVTKSDDSGRFLTEVNILVILAILDDSNGGELRVGPGLSRGFSLTNSEAGVSEVSILAQSCISWLFAGRVVRRVNKVVKVVIPGVHNVDQQ